MDYLRTEDELIATALELVGLHADLSASERELVHRVHAPVSQTSVDRTRDIILSGDDPLGDAFTRIRSPEKRRVDGATYTPQPIIDSMLSWAERESLPNRVVDPGTGSGRFLLGAAERFPETQLVGIEIDPVAALILRANITTRNLTERTTILVGDYRSVSLREVDGATVFIGNPPYVRHHTIPKNWKNWYAETASNFGVKASKLAGLHLHFFVKTMQLAKPGDFGAFITAAEWLDVNYGATLRQLLADGLGGCALHVIDPKANPFPDAATTAAITCFRVGRRPKSLRVSMVKSIEKLGRLSKGKAVSWDKVATTNRWSTIIRPGPKPPADYIELGEVCRVHRGQVTGGNKIWIANEKAKNLPAEVLKPSVTKAKDIMDAGGALADAERLRKVIDLPVDLDQLDRNFLPAVERFLIWAKANGAADSYIARHRRAWWAVGLREPAPILCTYMARRPPVFIRNLCDARHLNISHGLYPKKKLTEKTLSALIAYLQRHIRTDFGRTYAGGLTKFEPRELERVPIPRLEHLAV